MFASVTFPAKMLKYWKIAVCCLYAASVCDHNAVSGRAGSYMAATLELQHDFCYVCMLTAHTCS